MPLLDSILSQVAKMGASDVHLAVGAPPIVRLYGQLKRARRADFTTQETEQILNEVISPEQKQVLATQMQLEFAYEIPGLARFRGNAVRQRKGLDLCFRIIKPNIPSFEELGIPPAMHKVLDNHQGLILVTGPAGSGKTTTLAAMVDYVNTTRPHHVLTIEDPIEQVHPIKKGVVNQRQVGRHTKSYANALRASLREDPDVIVVGELRDLETISLAMSASETGHLVIGSMNTSSASKTVDKIIDSYPSGQQNQIRAMMGESLRAVFTQRLLPRANGAGVVMAYELLLGTRQLANLIKDAKTFQIPNIMQIGKNLGMRLMDESLIDLIKAGTIAPEVGVRNGTNLKLFAQWAPGAAAAEGAPPEGAGAAAKSPPGAVGVRKGPGGGA